MKMSQFISTVTLAIMCLARLSHAQGTFAPLYLFTNGGGSMTPLQNGQLLQVGQTYDMTAIPDSGFAFSSWQPVNVFTFTEFIINPSGDTNFVVSVTASPVPEYTSQPMLEFTMQPVAVIYDNPGVRTITEGTGWQANFVTIPEPSSSMLIASGLTATMLFGCRRFQHRAGGLRDCHISRGTGSAEPARRLFPLRLHSVFANWT